MNTKAQKMILRNTFHDNETTTRLTQDEINRIKNTEPAAWTVAEKRAVRKIWTKLCGINGCTCGDIFGVRDRD